MARREYSKETQAAVMASLLTGQSVSAVARQYDVPKGTVSAWKSRAVDVVGMVVAEDATQKSQIGASLLAYLAEALETLRKQLRVFGDETWLKRQSASEAAVLHGVLTDKTIRLLEALANDKREGDTDV